MIDFWKLTKDFAPGDTVQRFAPGSGGFSMSPFVGRVTAVHRGLGVLDVQFPYGNERVFPDDIVKVDPKVSQWMPPTLDQTYSSWDTTRKAKSSEWRTTEVPPTFHKDLALAWSKGASEVAAYDFLWHRHAASANDFVIRDEVAKFYLVARNLVALRFQQHAHKSAAYWANSNRQYRATSAELNSRKPSCPKCGTTMRKTTYKMREGARERLFACPKDLFLLKQTDIVGPDGQPVEW